MVKRLWLWLVALAIVLGPSGLSESVENLTHLAITGHVAHAEAAPEEQEGHRDLEHGCVGGFHTCVCCSHPPLLFTVEDVVAPSPAEAVATFPLHRVASGPRGERARIFRPPLG